MFVISMSGLMVAVHMNPYNLSLTTLNTVCHGLTGKTRTSTHSRKLSLVQDFWSLSSVSEACGHSLPAEAPLLSKFGNLSIQESLVPTSAYLRPSVHALGEGSPKTTQGGKRMSSFLGGNHVVLLGNQRFSWREIAGPSPF